MARPQAATWDPKSAILSRTLRIIDTAARGVKTVHGIIDPAALYAAHGLQFLPFTTVYQLAVDRDEDMLDAATTMLLIPDLIAYWLTGEQRDERTNASTTGLLDVVDHGWNDSLRSKLGLPAALLPALVDPESASADWRRASRTRSAPPSRSSPSAPTTPPLLSRVSP